MTRQSLADGKPRTATLSRIMGREINGDALGGGVEIRSGRSGGDGV